MRLFILVFKLSSAKLILFSRRNNKIIQLIFTIYEQYLLYDIINKDNGVNVTGGNTYGFYEKPHF